MLNVTVTFPVIALCYQPLSNVPLQIRAMVVLNHRVQKDTRVPSAQLAPQISFSVLTDLQPTIFQNPIGNESIFVFLNSAVVLIVVGKFYLLTISNDRFC